MMWEVNFDVYFEIKVKVFTGRCHAHHKTQPITWAAYELGRGPDYDYVIPREFFF